MEIIPDEKEVAIDAIPLAMGRLNLILWGDLKTMFEPHVEDKVWKNQQDYKVLNWKLYDSYGVHSLRIQHMQIYMLVENKYPLAPLTLSMMLEKKLIIDYESEMAYRLLKLIIKQLKNGINKDAEHEVLKREHSKKVKRLTKLNRRRAEEYMWTMTNRIKPKLITDVRIYPNTKPIIASVFRNIDKRNFDVYQPFKFLDFGITELDELGPIIQKKKNFVVKDLMTSLSKRYERLNKILKELGIQSALPAPIHEQASSQTLGRKRKHMELEP
ncbi:hypothetical protein Tco_0265998 [Tanacetum coccineum]